MLPDRGISKETDYAAIPGDLWPITRFKIGYAPHASRNNLGMDRHRYMAVVPCNGLGANFLSDGHES